MSVTKNTAHPVGSVREKREEVSHRGHIEHGEGMSEGLPQGWVGTTLQNVVKHRKGEKPSQTSTEYVKGLIPYLLIDEMEGKPIRNYTDDLSVPIANKNDVLIVWDGSIGKTATGLSGAIGSTIAALTPFVVPANFLEYFLKTAKPFIEQTSRGTGLQHVNPKTFWPMEFPLPPLNEQKRIVAKLDAIMPRIEAVKERLEKVPAILKRFRQSVLTAAVTGRLTEKWRVEHPDVGGWDEKLLDEIIEEGPQNGLYKSQDFYENGILILRIDNFYNGSINPWDTLKRLEVTDSEKSTYLLNNGDIVINRVNSMPFLGKSALVRGLKENCVFESNMMRIKLNENTANSEYIIRYLNCQNGLTELRKKAKHAVNQSSINQQDVKAVNCPLPPLEEQKQIAKEVDKLFALADKVEAHYLKAKARVDKLSQSVLAKAFRGELVPQNPNDEPAEKLLERIMEEKAKMKAKLKAAKSAVRKKNSKEEKGK